MEQSKIDRINELARRSKAEGLTEAEKKEQGLLRQEFLAAVRMNLKSQLDQIANIRRNLRAQLDNIDVVNPDGTIENLGEKVNASDKN